MRCRNTTIVIVVLAIFWPVLAGSAQEAKILPLVQGEIKKVDESADKITIKHAAIPNLNMDGMTMVFKAREPAMVSQVKPGDKVMFSADKVNGQLTVMTIQKAK